MQDELQAKKQADDAHGEASSRYSAF